MKQLLTILLIITALSATGQVDSFSKEGVMYYTHDATTKPVRYFWPVVAKRRIANADTIISAPMFYSVSYPVFHIVPEKAPVLSTSKDGNYTYIESDKAGVAKIYAYNKQASPPLIAAKLKKGNTAIRISNLNVGKYVIHIRKDNGWDATYTLTRTSHY